MIDFSIYFSVRYVPEHLLEQIRNLSEDGRRELNTLNTNLVHQLKSADTAFSLGKMIHLRLLCCYLVIRETNSNYLLTHWGRDQIDAISQTTFSNAFSRMKMN